MSILVTDQGFGPAADDVTVDLGPDAEAITLASLLPGAELIRINFPSFGDGRGFTLARRLRDLGYAGRPCAPRATCCRTSTPWHGARASTRSRYPRTTPPASPRPTGSPAQTGAATTTRPGFAADRRLFPPEETH